ncbi:MAG: mini-ribonuclease [Thermotogaceae bacterium]|nr:mini-ribonuclease [Thermotogaceae bacterium]
MNLEELIFEDKEIDMKLVSSDLLAFIGDAFYSLYIKTKLIVRGDLKAGVVHEKAKERVFSKAQAISLEKLLDFLNESEKFVVRRALNSNGAKRYGNDHYYRKSTAFEALLGYHYLSKNFDRLNQLLKEVERCSCTE